MKRNVSGFFRRKSAVSCPCTAKTVILSLFSKFAENYENICPYYPAADYEQIWKAFDAVVKLWSIIGTDVSKRCGYVYPADTEKNMLELIRSMKG